MAGSNILHGAGIRVRVVGSGNLRSAMVGYDNIILNQMADVSLSATNARKVDRLGNIVSQGIKWRLHQDGTVGDFFRVNDVTTYVKQIFSQYPG